MGDKSIRYFKYTKFRKKIKEKKLKDILDNRPKHPGKCPFCDGDPQLKVDSSHVYYGNNRGPIWECDCGARVGCHEGTNLPLGTLANDRVRYFRRLAHYSFDKLWEKLSKTRFFIDRYGAYQWLAVKMGMEVSKCHIGMMNIEDCKKVIEFCDFLRETGVK